MRRAFLHSLCPWLITACMDLPPQPDLDAAPPELGPTSADGGARRPMTAAPYLGPECKADPVPAPVPASDGPGPDAGSSPSAPAQPGSEPVTPGPGALVITEVMADPEALRDDSGEWFEVYNAGALPIALAECTLDDGASSARTLPPLVLAPGAYAAFARSTEVAFSAAATLAFSLTNSADRLVLFCRGVELDRVAYGPGFPLKAGASMALDPEATDPQRNDTAGAWCLGRTELGGDFGSPGEANPDCDADADAGSEPPTP